MSVETLAYSHVVSDIYLRSADRAAVIDTVSTYGRKRIGEALMDYIAEHGPCVVSDLNQEVRNNTDPLTMGDTVVQKVYVLAIGDATEDDWHMMRDRCTP